MALADRILQKWRMSKAIKHIPDKSRLLDIGCFEGELFTYAGDRLSGGLGIDPLLSENTEKELSENVKLIKGFFPSDIPVETEKFDVITMLAVFEHISMEKVPEFLDALYNYLNQHGLVVLTIPSPFVDKILNILLKLHLIDATTLEEHHGLQIDTIPVFFRKYSFEMLVHTKFQLGLNNLFLFKKNEA